MDVDETKGRLDSDWFRFAETMSRFARAWYLFSGKSPTMRESIRRNFEDEAKKLLLACEEFGIDVHERKPNGDHD